MNRASHSDTAITGAKPGEGSDRKIAIVVLAHNEERRIAACLDSLPVSDPSASVHVVVNGTADRTAEIARTYEYVSVHEYAEGGKSRSWNRFLLDELPQHLAPDETAAIVLVDGDAQILPGSVEALAAHLHRDPALNAVAGMPMNGRNAAKYREGLVRDGGLFGDLYALRGSFLERMREAGIRLPVDLIGDDGLIASLAHTDLAGDNNWELSRVGACKDAGFLAEQFVPSPAGIRAQSGRMINYSVRHFQNRIVRGIMQSDGPAALPEQMASLYPQHLPSFTARRHPLWLWFDRQALARMARHSAEYQAQ